jgi:hypothetical protein
MRLGSFATLMLIGLTPLVSDSGYSQTEPAVQVEHSSRRAIASEGADTSKTRRGDSLAMPENDVAPPGAKQARPAVAPKSSEVSPGPAVGDEIR